MGATARTHIIRIGNSRGIRIPRLLLEQAGMSGEVQLEAMVDRIVIRPSRLPRQDWEDGFKAMGQQGDDRWVDGMSPPQASWDETDWEW